MAQPGSSGANEYQPSIDASAGTPTKSANRARHPSSACCCTASALGYSEVRMCQFRTAVAGRRPPRGPGLLASVRECGGGCRSDLPRGIRPLRRHDLPPHRAVGAEAPAALARPLAELRRRPAVRRSARPGASRLRPGHHPLRPREQLRPALWSRGVELRTTPRHDLAPYGDELVISTKAGWDMWPGPYGVGGSRKHLLASLDRSLERLGARRRRTSRTSRRRAARRTERRHRARTPGPCAHRGTRRRRGGSAVAPAASARRERMPRGRPMPSAPTGSGHRSRVRSPRPGARRRIPSAAAPRPRPPS